MKRILWCRSCSIYTMKETCRCGRKTIAKIPPKYSPEDKYGKYRRKTKEQEWKKKGLL